MCLLFRMVLSRDDLDDDDENVNIPDARQPVDLSEESLEHKSALSFRDNPTKSGSEKTHLTEDKIADLMNKFDEKLRIMEKEDEYAQLTNIPINIELRIDEPGDFRNKTTVKTTQSHNEIRRLNLIQSGGAEAPQKKISPSSSSFDRSFRLSNESRSFLVNAKIAEEEVDDLTEMSNENNCADAKQEQPNGVLTQKLFESDLRRRQMELQASTHPISSTIRIQPIDASNTRDLIENFCYKHADKIRHYMGNLERILPIAITDPMYDYGLLNKTLIKNTSKSGSKSKRKIILKFACNSKSENCLFGQNPFEITTSYPSTWIHLIFLSIQVKRYCVELWVFVGF
jgi:hypothetical protein